MRTRKVVQSEWNTWIDNHKGEGYPLGMMFDVLLDIRELLAEKAEEQKAQLGTCINCGLFKKLWDKSFCLEGREHTE